MELAFEEAQQTQYLGEVPVGAVIVINNEIIAKAGNRVITDCDPTKHAEMIVIQNAAKIIGYERLEEASLYVTLEPCAMCAGAMSLARIKNLYFGAYDPKGGAIDHGPRFFHQPTCHHSPEVFGGILEQKCQKLLSNFFRNLRDSD